MAGPLTLTRTHRILVGLVVSGAVLIAGIGFAGSYSAVRALAARKGFGDFSLVFPIGIDAGICVLLALDLLLTWIRIPFPLLRQTAWLLTAATIAFNGAAAWPDPLGVGMHAVIPVLFVVSVEAARHAIGRIADITADKHMEGVRLTRWLLSPVPTFLLWRRMKLWELRSYEQTIKLEQERLVYQARLHSRFGRYWRRKAPVESLMPLRLARYGVPLKETAAAGLAAAGIEPTLLPSAPTRELEPAAEPHLAQRTPGMLARRPAPSSAEPGVHGAHDPAQHPDQSPLFAAPRPQHNGYDGSYDPSYAPDEQYEQWYAEQQQQAQAQQGQPQHAQPQTEQPQAAQQHAAAQAHAAQQQFAAQQQYANGRQYAEAHPYAEAQPSPQGQQLIPQPYAPQQNPDPAAPHAPVLNGGAPGHDAANGAFAGEPANPFRVPAGPGRTRPLGGNHFPIPAPRTEQQPRPAGHRGTEPTEQTWHAGHAELAGPAAHVEPSAAAADFPQPEPAAADEPLPSGTLPDGRPLDKAYFEAFQRYVHEHMDFPNARQFGLYLQSLYGVIGQSGGPLTEQTLRPYLKDLRDRYQQDPEGTATATADAEHIA